MSIRGILLLATLFGAVAAPYFLTNPENREKVTTWLQSFRNGSDENDSSVAWMYTDLQTASSSSILPYLSAENDGQPQSPAGKPFKQKNSTPEVPLEQLIRFDIAPTWVIDTWPRVTTRLYDGALEGVRVPVLTGTAAHDLVGSLTYYFDKQLKVQRIVLRGQTGDARRFVAFITQYYELQLEPGLGGWFFTAKWNGSPSSIMHVQHSPVVNEENRRRRVQIDLELNIPGSPHGVSAELKQRIRDREKQRESQPESVVNVGR